MSKKHLTKENLKAIFNYDKDSGTFTRIISSGKSKAGKPTGSILPCGYVYLTAYNNKFLAHRVAWLFIYGEFPKGEIDHINGVKTDNRIENLRIASTKQNQENRKRAQITNSTGLLGVSKFRKIWRARITVDGKEIHLGLFKTPEEAHNAYLESKRKLHQFCTL